MKWVLKNLLPIYGGAYGTGLVAGLGVLFFAPNSYAMSLTRWILAMALLFVLSARVVSYVATKFMPSDLREMAWTDINFSTTSSMTGASRIAFWAQVVGAFVGIAALGMMSLALVAWLLGGVK